MSIRTIIQCIAYSYKYSKRKKNEIIDFGKIENIEFKEISGIFPEKHFMFHDEPLIILNHIIKQNMCFLLSKNAMFKCEELYDALQSLILEKKEGVVTVPLNRIVGELHTKETAKITFEEFKEIQFKRNKKEKNFDDYNKLRYEVFEKDSPGDAFPITDVKFIEYCKKYYFSNSNKSHRAALLCKWNDVAKFNDSQDFNVTSYIINSEAKKYLQKKYFGFITSTENLKELFKTVYNQKFEIWLDLYVLKEGTRLYYVDAACFFIKREDTSQNLIEYFNKLISEDKLFSLNNFFVGTENQNM